MNAICNHRPAILLAFIALFPNAAAHAHEFWIEPSTHVAHPGERVSVALRVGEHFAGQPVPRKNSRIERFAAIRADASPMELGFTPIVGPDGAEPAGRFDANQPGLLILVYDSNHAAITLDGESFDAYLQEKGLDAVRDARAKAGRQADDAREIYSRCAKSLVLVRADGDRPLTEKNRDRPVGLPLEIVAAFDPFAHAADKPMPFRVLFNSKPLAGAMVTATSRRDPQNAQHARTDADGRVQFRITDAGPWLVDCTHMLTLHNKMTTGDAHNNDNEGGDAANAGSFDTDPAHADYESFWASLTFELSN